MSDQQPNRARDRKIAQNEAKRELTSDIRLSTWATALSVIVGLALVMFFLMRK